MKPGGRFGYIVANKWMRAAYGKNLRRWLATQCIEEIDDYGDLPVFENATTYPCLLFLRKEAKKEDLMIANVRKLDWTKSQEDLIAPERFVLPREALHEDGWTLAEPGIHKCSRSLRFQWTRTMREFFPLGVTTIAAFDYTFDHVGNRKTKVSPTGTESYLYDELYRITSVTYPNSAASSYTYDATGNRTAKTDVGGTTNYTYDVADQLTNAGDGVRTYDNDGQLTQIGGHLGYTWDARQQLASITDAPTNTAPTANAGPDLVGYVNRMVFVDGSASSDAQGEKLRYTWSEDAGDTTTGTLTGVHASRAAFVAATAGTYHLNLIVNDGRTDSASDQVTITVNSGTPPDQLLDVVPASGTSGYVVSTSPTSRFFGTANYTMDTGHPGSTSTKMGAAQFSLPSQPQFTALSNVQLFLTGSSNSGNTSSDQWSVKVLPGSLDTNWTTQTWNSISAATPDATMTPVLTGTGQIVSGVVRTFSLASGDLPVAQARLDGSQKLSIRTQLDAGGSTSMGYWASGNNTNTSWRPKLRFTFSAAPIPNQTPIAQVGREQTVLTNAHVTLDGSDSYDYEGGVTYAWTPASTNPEAVTLSDPTAAQPTFTPTKTGVYTFSLVVTDANSVPSVAAVAKVNVVKELPAHTTSFTYNGNGDRIKQTKDGVDTSYVVESIPDIERLLLCFCFHDFIRAAAEECMRHGRDRVAGMMRGERDAERLRPPERRVECEEDTPILSCECADDIGDGFLRALRRVIHDKPAAASLADRDADLRGIDGAIDADDPPAVHVTSVHERLCSAHGERARRPDGSQADSY